MTQAPDSPRYSAGQRVGEKYRLLHRLDEGGMGTVWEAVNIDLAVAVAIKLIRPELVGSAAAERLVHEARILARLEHPGIIRVFDCGETSEGVPFIVMELLRGESLADTLAREIAIAPIRAIGLLLPIVDAVEAAHQRGVVHRDLKPENIYLAEQPGGRVQPKLLDFGIARSNTTQNLRLTTDGSLLGSPQYMSPEQARGLSDVDARADVWALSIVIYETISGRAPFSGENYHAILRSIIDDEPPSLIDLGIGDALLSSIVERGLRKDRDERWSSMREIGVALAQWLWGQGVVEDAAAVSIRSAWLGCPASVPPVSLPASEPPSALASAPSYSSNPLATPPPVMRSSPSASLVGHDSDSRLSAVGVLIDEPAPVRSRSRAAVVGVLGIAALVAAAIGTWQSIALDRSSAAVAAPPPAVTPSIYPIEPSIAPIEPTVSDPEPEPVAIAKPPSTKKAAQKRELRVTPARAPQRSPARSRRDLKDPY